MAISPDGAAKGAKKGLGERMKTWLEAVKIGAQLVVWGFIASALILLIFFPVVFAERGKLVLEALKREGIVATASFGGFDFSLAEEEIKEEIAEADSRLAKLQQAALCIETSSCTEADLEKVATLLGLKAVQAREADETPLITGEAPWVVIAGADRSVAAARDEVARLGRAGFEARLLRADGWIRTIVPYPSRAEAEEKVAEIDAASAGRGAYARALYQLCEVVSESKETPGVLDCGKWGSGGGF